MASDFPWNWSWRQLWVAQDGCWVWNSGDLEEDYVLWTAEPPLQFWNILKTGSSMLSKPGNWCWHLQLASTLTRVIDSYIKPVETATEWACPCPVRTVAHDKLLCSSECSAFSLPTKKLWVELGLQKGFSWRPLNKLLRTNVTSFWLHSMVLFVLLLFVCLLSETGSLCVVFSV